MKWIKKDNYRWESDEGHRILKYHMGGKRPYKFLLYQPGEPLEYGDYKSFDYLKEAKEYVTTNRC